LLKNDPSKKYLLKPNQKLVLSNESLLAPVKTAGTGENVASPVKFNPKAEVMELSYLDDAKTDVESSWTRNVLSFEDEQFSEVAKKLERWYDVTIQFKNKRWEREYMSGSFEQESLEQAMKALKYSTGFNFKTDGKIITIY
jgi:transmembrane sensor